MSGFEKNISWARAQAAITGEREAVLDDVALANRALRIKDGLVLQGQDHAQLAGFVDEIVVSHQRLAELASAGFADRDDAKLGREVVRYTGMTFPELITAAESQGVNRYDCDRWSYERLRDHLVTGAVARHRRSGHQSAEVQP